MKLAHSLTLATCAAITMTSAAHAAGWSPLSDESDRSIYAASSDGGVVIGCTASRKPAVAFAYDGSSLPDAVDDPSDRMKFRRGSVYVNGEEVYNGKFIYRPSSKLAETNHPSVAIAIYNAAIRGDTVELELNNYGSVEVELPEVDDTFRAYAGACIK